MKIEQKLLVTGVGISAFMCLILLAISFWQSRSTEEIAAEEVLQLVREKQEHIVGGIVGMVTAQQEVLEQKVLSDLRVAQDVLNRTGAIIFDDLQPVEWTAINQFSQAAQQLQLPRMLVGDIWLGQNTDPAQPSPIVDRVRELVGGTATIFQRMNPAGDMLRVCTNVETLEHKRAIGTYIPAKNPDGTPNPILAKVLAGERYIGRAYVVNRWYVAAYEPIHVNGQVAGVLFVGVPEESATSLRQQIMDVVVGDTGYVYVVDPKGYYLISHHGERDGELIWEAKDTDGNFFIQEAIKRAMALQPGEFSEIRYPWQNRGDPAPRYKTVTLGYFAPWQWIIGVGSWDEEILQAETRIHETNQQSRQTMLLLAIASLATTAIVWFFLARTISRPIVRTSLLIKDLSEGDGDLTKRLPISGRDEIGEMAGHFNAFLDKLHSLISAIKENAQSVAAAAVQLSAVSTQIAKNAEHMSGQTDEASSAAGKAQSGISAIAAEASRMADSATSVAAAIEEMNASIGEVSRSCSEESRIARDAEAEASKTRDLMARLGESAEQIGRVVGLIDGIASQTNLLALNASIEAASAGEAGRGFAVVATEVKELARQTAEATRQIATQIAEMQGSTQTSIAAIGQMSSVIEQISGISQTIASTVEEQSATTSEIAKTVSGISVSTKDLAQNATASSASAEVLSHNVQSVTTAASEVAGGATETQASSQELAKMAERLQALVGRFKL